MVDGRARIKSPPLLVPMEELLGQEGTRVAYERLGSLHEAYRRTLRSDRRHLLEQFTLVQVARKVAGVGSVGTRSWILLLEGLDSPDPLLQQAKQAHASVLSGFVKTNCAQNQGERVVNGQHLMQASRASSSRGNARKARRGKARLLCAAAPRWQRIGGGPGDGPRWDALLRVYRWTDPGPSACPLWRPGRHRRVPGFQ
jgi:hypothetical protein